MARPTFWTLQKVVLEYKRIKPISRYDWNKKSTGSYLWAWRHGKLDLVEKLASKENPVSEYPTDGFLDDNTRLYGFHYSDTYPSIPKELSKYLDSVCIIPTPAYPISHRNYELDSVQYLLTGVNKPVPETKLVKFEKPILPSDRLVFEKIIVKNSQKRSVLFLSDELMLIIALAGATLCLLF